MNYDRKARLIADSFYKLGPNQDALSGLIAAALREAAAEAFEEARDRARIEVNACVGHAKATSELNHMVPIRVLHEAAGNVAKVVSEWCGARAAALRPAPGERGEGK